MRHLSLIVVFLLIGFTAFAQDAKQQRINQAIDAAERICLVGNRYKFAANVSGSVTITKLLPGGNAKVDVDKAEGKGSQFFEDEKVRQLVDKDIRDCMKDQWPAVLQAIEAAIPTKKVIKVCMGNGNGLSCLGDANAAYNCDAYNNMGGGSPKTYELLKSTFCADSPSNVTNTYNVGGGQCGWTGFTITCNP